MSHSSQVIKVSEPADGLLAVHVRCCDDPTTDSVLTLHELHRSEEEIDADILAHQARVESVHAQKIRAKAHMARLMGQLSEDCKCKE